MALRTDNKPVMAVLVRNHSISSLRNQGIRPYIQWLAAANKEVNNILYCFALNQVRLKEGIITGYYWHNRHNRWLPQEFPLPDVLYIKGGIDKKYAHTFQELCSMIKKNNGKLITHYCFNKWRLYQVLNNDPVLKKYLPATTTVKHPDNIKRALQDYRIVYLKSHFGRKGETTIRVETLPGGSYLYSHFKNGRLTKKTFFGFQPLLDTINRFYHGKRFLVQQAIQLLRFRSRLMDMRAEVQRNGEGGLDVAGISVRLGQPGSPITTHGDAYKFNDFFVNKMGYSKERMEALRSAVHEFLFSLYEYIANNYNEYAEMGIDFAVDTNGKIWFIEANSQSTKVSLNKAYGKAALYRNSKNILEYARYLAKQPL